MAKVAKRRTIPEKKEAIKASLGYGDYVMVEWNPNPLHDEVERIHGRFGRLVHRSGQVLIEVHGRWENPQTGEWAQYGAAIPLKLVTRVRRLTVGSGTAVL